MIWIRIISGALAASMMLTAPVQLLASAEDADVADSAPAAESTETPDGENAWEDLFSSEDIDDTNTFYYNKGGYSFEKLTHPEKDVKTDATSESYNAGDRGQNYSWAAIGYGDWLYVGTCYAAMGNTLTLMKSSLGDKYDNKVLQATFDAMFNGDFFNAEEDGVDARGGIPTVSTETRRGY